MPDQDHPDQEARAKHGRLPNADGRSTDPRGVHRSSFIVLASASPRRRELLRALSLPFRVQVADVPEPLSTGVPAAEQAVALALAKARAIAPAADPLVLGADTIVVLDGVPLGKPESAEEARQMLAALRGRAHDVITGVALVTGKQQWTAHASTAVWMRSYTDAAIEDYIATGDPFDKAGAYAIQHPGFRPVERIHGCYCNVMGLPLWTVRALLQDTGRTSTVGRPGDQIDRCRTCPLAEWGVS